MIAFFTAGSMIQVVLSILVSVCALAYHTHALPYRESWLNIMQGACLFFIYLTLQAGLAVRFTPKPLPDGNLGDALLVALSVANVVMLVSPFVMGVFIGLQILPESVRMRVLAFLTGKATVATAEPALEPEQQPCRAQLDLEGDELEDAVQVSVVADHDPVTVDADDATHIELAPLPPSTADSQQPALDAWQSDTTLDPEQVVAAADPPTPELLDAPPQPPDEADLPKKKKQVFLYR